MGISLHQLQRTEWSADDTALVEAIHAIKDEFEGRRACMHRGGFGTFGPREHACRAAPVFVRDAPDWSDSPVVG